LNLGLGKIGFFLLRKFLPMWVMVTLDPVVSLKIGKNLQRKANQLAVLNL